MEEPIPNCDTHEQAVGCISCWFAGILTHEQFGRPSGIWRGEDCPLCGRRDRLIVTEPSPRSVPVELPFVPLSPYIHPRELVEDYLAQALKRGGR